MNPPSTSSSSTSLFPQAGATAEAKDTSFSIREKQKEAILRFLNLNNDDDSSESWQGVWKVLLYDDYCRDIIAPLFKVGDLRKQGITLHLSLQGDRQAIPDVPAIYFVSPTRDNIQRIARDCTSHLYDSIHLNFSSSVPRPLLEELAEATLVQSSGAAADAPSRIAKIYDQYVHFLALEDRLFTLAQDRSYVAFNSPSITDAQAEANVESLALSLYSAIVTLGQVPIIRAPRNSAASMVAKRLCDRLRDHLLKSSALSDSLGTSFQRPLLVLVDRNVDMSVMFHHTWTYQALVHDLLDMKLNKVRLQQEIESDSGQPTGRMETKAYDLDPASDAFWVASAGNPWPKVVVDVQAQVKEVTSIMEEVNKLKVNEDDDPLASLDRTKHLSSFVGSIFELTEKKRLVDMHLTLAKALFERIKQRNLDAYLKLEEAITTHSADKKEIMALLTSKTDTAEDKLRLFLIYYLTTAIPDDELSKYEAALTEAGVDLRPFHYLKKVKAFNNSLLGGAKGGAGRSTGGSMRGSVTTSLASLVQQGVNHIKTWIPSSRHLYLTRVVDALMEQRGGSSLGVEEQYEYYDPKLTNLAASSVPRKNTPYSHALVFVIGGGNYVEFQNLQDYAKEQPKGAGETPKQIIYGSTEILSARQFLDQLAELA